MISKAFSIGCLIFMFAVTSVMAQNAVSDSCIVDHLQRSFAGRGQVKIFQSDQLASRLGRRGQGVYVEGDDKSYVTASGYRILVFSGNNQRKSKEEAETKRNQLRDFDPALKTYITLDSPFWRLTAGNYRTYLEADQQLRVLRQAFPQLGKEMYIVKDKIQIPLHPESDNNGFEIEQ